MSDVERAGTAKRALMISRKPLRAESPIPTGLFRRKLSDYYYDDYSYDYSYDYSPQNPLSVASYSTQTNLTSL